MTDNNVRIRLVEPTPRHRMTKRSCVGFCARFSFCWLSLSHTLTFCFSVTILFAVRRVGNFVYCILIFIVTAARSSCVKFLFLFLFFIEIWILWILQPNANTTYWMDNRCHLLQQLLRHTKQPWKYVMRRWSKIANAMKERKRKKSLVATCMVCVRFVSCVALIIHSSYQMYGKRLTTPEHTAHIESCSQLGNFFVQALYGLCRTFRTTCVRHIVYIFSGHKMFWGHEIELNVL